MKLEPNNLYLGDCYELIKEIPDKSIDLVYIDIPYEFVGSGGAGAFGKRARNYHDEYLKVSVDPKVSKLAKRKSYYSLKLQPISQGISPNIWDELCRVMKHIYIYIYGVAKHKYQN